MTAAKGNHVVQRWVVADATARAALVLAAEDVGGVARQLSDNTFWRLDNEAGPVWTQWGGAVTLNSDAVVNLSTAVGANVTAALNYLVGLVAALAVTLGTRIGLSDLVVANVAALTSVNAPDGTHLYVRTLRDSFVYRAGSTETVDNISIAAAFGGTGRWERLLEYHPSWARQDTWYIDPTVGADENDASISSPIASFAEVIRRLGVRYHCRNYSAQPFTTGRSQTFWVLGDLSNEAVAWDLSSDRNVTIRIKGVLSSALFTGTISAKTAYAQATDTPAAVTSTWTPATEIGRVVKSGTSYAWVAKDNGGGSARLSPWCTETNETFNLAALATEPVVGATITTHNTLSKIGYLNLRIAGGNGSRGVIIEDVLVVTYLSLAANGGQHIFNRCSFTPSTTRYVGAAFGFNNCYLPINLSAAYGNETAAQNFYSAGLVRGTQTSSSGAHKSQMALTSGILFQGCGVSLNGMSLRVSNLGALFMDCATDVITLTANSDVRTTAPIGGTGNTLYGVRLQCSQMLVDSGVTNTLAGTSGQIALGRATGVPATQTTAWAFDDTTGAKVTAGGKRAVTYANLALAVASGGFGGVIESEATGSGVRIN